METSSLRKHWKKILLALLILLCLIPALTVLPFLELPVVVRNLCMSPVGGLLDDDTWVSLYRTASFSSRDRFARRFEEYDDIATIRLMLLGYREDEPIYEPLLIHGLKEPFNAPLVIRLMAENKGITTLSDSALEETVSLAKQDREDGENMLIYIPVAWAKFFYKDKEKSKYIVDKVSEIWGIPIFKYSEEPDPHGSYLMMGKDDDYKFFFREE